MKRGVYLATEKGIKKGSGAHKHIEVGVEELSRKFEIIVYPKTGASLGPPAVLPAGKQNDAPRKNNFLHPFFTYFKSALKGFYHLYKENRGFFAAYREIKKLAPDFIFERSAYLSYKGQWVAYLLRVPHFYEVNGILWLDRAMYFPGWWNRLARRLENRHYRNAAHVFFVGGIGKYFKIPEEKASSIQNGIERSFAEHFVHHRKTISLPLEVVFIGHAMPHHKIDVLCKATHLVQNPANFRLHFIGAALDQYKSLLHPGWQVVFHGVQSHENIALLLEKAHIGIVPYVRDYFSNVKLFMYGAAKLGVMVPLLGNIRDIFSGSEIIEINNEDAVHIAKQLEWAAANPEAVASLGERCFDKVYNQFTWENIYDVVSKTIETKL